MDGENRDFSFKSGLYQGGTFQITKITGATGTLPAAAAYNAKATISDLKAAGNDYVVVTIDTSKLEAETTHTVAQYSDSTVTVQATPNSGEGSYNTMIQAKLNSAPSAGIYGYVVTVTIDGTKVGSAVVTKTSYTNIDRFNVTKNISASDYTVTADPISKPTVKTLSNGKANVSVNNTEYRVEFDRTLAKLDQTKVTLTAGTSSAAKVAVSIDGNVLVIMTDKALVATEAIVIDAQAIEDASNSDNANEKVTLTLGADGSWTASA